jgi:hypothetical protein
VPSTYAATTATAQINVNIDVKVKVIDNYAIYGVAAIIATD